ncbi:MAG TPA: aminotransferase class I/II-fold pyridoxal phosphate-dependent enzyme [Candidatus Obscuribacterales bacterium]
MTTADDTPLLTALAIAAQRQQAAFYAPGHKGGQGVSPQLRAVMGSAALRADLPELPELDNLFAPTGPIRAAQDLAAQAFGAEETFFLANGSTCGIEAAVLATCAPGDQVLVPRHAHRSVLAALVLTGAQPIYLAPMQAERWDLAWGCTAAQVEQALITHPGVRVVVVVSPSYHGVCSDVAAIARCVHAHGGLLLVDEAHGAHLGFHDQLPPGAIAGGADVVIQSTHKVLSALTQASMLHVQGPRVDRDRLRQALQLTQSTSPNYLLLASLDAARHQMATMGIDLMARTLDLAQSVRSRLTALAPLGVLSPAHLAPAAGNFSLDVTRLVVDVAPLGITGFAADEQLHGAGGVTAELPTLRQLAFILTLGNPMADGDRLVTALAALVAQADSPAVAPTAALPPQAPPPALSVPPLTPRAAFFAPQQAVELAAAIGRICATPICPYPPGIPVLLPGELITAEAIATLQRLHQAGSVITGLGETTPPTVRVVQV